MDGHRVTIPTNRETRRAVCRIPRLVFVALLAGFGLVLTLAASHLSFALDAANDPMAEVKAAINDAIAVFKNRQIPLKERREKLREIAEKHFDFRFMARSAVGYHWRILSPAQREEFVPLFTSFMEDVYLNQLQEYTVEKVEENVKTVEISFTKESFDGPQYAKVDSTVVLQDRPNPIQVSYLLRQNGGNWKIYDITVDAISVMANYRNQFNRVINNQGYDTLVSDLRKKQEALASSLGK
jgi:phospholipid transport system substrate-binding protein